MYQDELVKTLKMEREHWFKRAMYYKNKMYKAQIISYLTAFTLIAGILFQWFVHNF